MAAVTGTKIPSLPLRGAVRRWSDTFCESICDL
jgi:hypothetical protein